MQSLLKSAVAGVALLAASVAAQAADINIVVVSHGQASDPFWSVVKNGVAEAAKDTGVKVDYRAPETFDMVQMAQLIDAAINQKPQGIVVSIPDADALGPSIQRAVAAGIPVISMNSGSDASKKLGALLHVGQDEFDAGKVAGEALKNAGGKKGICVNQEVGNVSLDQRCAGFKEGFGEVTVLPDAAVDTILTLNATLAGEPAVKAAAESGRSGIHVATFDMSAGFLEAVEKGQADFAIDQQQFLQGYLPVSFLALNAKYGLMPGGNVPSGPNLITKDKAKQVVELSAKGIR